MAILVDRENQHQSDAGHEFKSHSPHHMILMFYRASQDQEDHLALQLTAF